MPKNFRVIGWMVLILLSAISIFYLHNIELNPIAEVSSSVHPGMDVEFSKHLVETLRKVMIATFH